MKRFERFLKKSVAWLITLTLLTVCSPVGNTVYAESESMSGGNSIAVTKHTVTILNGYADVIGAGSYAPGETVYISAGRTPPPDGYGNEVSFAGWSAGEEDIDFANPDSAQTSFIMPDRDVILLIWWFNWDGNQGTLSVSPGALSLKVGESKACKAMFTQGGQDTDVTGQVEWRSGNTAVATVDVSGRVTAVSPGVASISATYQDMPPVIITVNVEAVGGDNGNGTGGENGNGVGNENQTEALSVTPNSLDLKVGNSASCKVMFKKGSHATDVTGQVEWQSENKFVATVDDSGSVTAVAQGKGIITATYYGADSGVLKVTFNVNVTAAGTSGGTQGGSDVNDSGKQAGAGGGKVATPGAGKATNPAATIAKIAFNKIKVGKKQISVTWKKAANVTAYQIQYRIKGSIKWKTKTVYTDKKSTTLTFKKLKAGKKYELRIRAYRMLIGEIYYGDWSKVKNSKKIK